MNVSASWIFKVTEENPEEPTLPVEVPQQHARVPEMIWIWIFPSSIMNPPEASTRGMLSGLNTVLFTLHTFLIRNIYGRHRHGSRQIWGDEGVEEENRGGMRGEIRRGRKEERMRCSMYSIFSLRSSWKTTILWGEGISHPAVVILISKYLQVAAAGGCCQTHLLNCFCKTCALRWIGGQFLGNGWLSAASCQHVAAWVSMCCGRVRPGDAHEQEGQEIAVMIFGSLQMHL